MNTIAKQFFLVFFLCLALSVNAQEEKAKELQTKIEQSKTDTERLKWVDSLAYITFYDNYFEAKEFIPHAEQAVELAIAVENYDIAALHNRNLITHYNNYVGKPEKGFEIFQSFLPYLPKVTDQELVTDLYIEGGDAEFFLDHVEESTALYEKAIAHAKKHHVDKKMGVATMYKGVNYSVLGDFVNASLTTQEAVKVFQNLKDSNNLIKARDNLATIYSHNGFYEEADQERQEIIKLAEKTKFYDILGPLYVNSSVDAWKQKDYQTQLEKLRLARQYSLKSKIDEFNYIPIACRFAECYVELGNLPEANKELQAAKNYAKENNITSFNDLILKAEMIIALGNGEVNKAVNLGEKHLTSRKQGSDYEEIMYAENFLANAYDRLGNSKKSLLHHKNYAKLKDSIFNNRKLNALSYYQTLYETEKRDAKISAQQADIGLLQAKNKLRNRQLFFGLFSLASIFGLIYLSRSRKFAIAKKQQQEQFARDLIRSTEEERKRISSDIHDSIGQSLLLIKNKILLNPEEAKKDISIVDDAIHEVRAISQALHPYQFESLGLLKSLAHLVDQFQSNSDTFYSHDIEVEQVELTENVAIFVYRIMQEALNNVEKHADAIACNLSVREVNDFLEFQVRDNGKGFDLTENSKLLNSLGMKTLKERAQIIGGQLLIESTAGSGTVVNLKIPTK